jgi:hypothetical protein
MILEKCIELQLGDKCNNSIGETSDKKSDECIDHRMSSFFEFFLFSGREDHLDSGPGDSQDCEDSCESDEPGDDRSNGSTSLKTALYIGESDLAWRCNHIDSPI